MPPLDDVLAEVDAWFAEEVQRAPLSYHTECYNQMYAAKTNLRNRLAVVITGKPLPPLAPPQEDEAAAEGSDLAEEPEKAPSTPIGAGKGSTKPKAE